jgi:hypothetical protein
MVVDFPTAYDHTKHCGPEKQIVFYALSVACTGCGSMKSIGQIRAIIPTRYHAVRADMRPQTTR